MFAFALFNPFVITGLATAIASVVTVRTVVFAFVRTRDEAPLAPADPAVSSAHYRTAMTGYALQLAGPVAGVALAFVLVAQGGGDAISELVMGICGVLFAVVLALGISLTGVSVASRGAMAYAAIAGADRSARTRRLLAISTVAAALWLLQFSFTVFNVIAAAAEGL